LLRNPKFRSGEVFLKAHLIIIAACIFFVTSTAFAQEQPAAGGLLTNPVFKKNCVKCHGKTAEGRKFGGPSLASGKVAVMSAGDVRNTISNGRGRMPKHAGKLTSEEIDTLAQEIKALKEK
jgi:mono/diheme cytochrome c family protein